MGRTLLTSGPILRRAKKNGGKEHSPIALCIAGERGYRARQLTQYPYRLLPGECPCGTVNPFEVLKMCLRSQSIVTIGFGVGRARVLSLCVPNRCCDSQVRSADCS